MEANFSKDITHSFILSEDATKKIHSLLRKHIGPIELKTDCADEISRKFSAIDDLFGFENPKEKRILKLSISAKSEDYSKRASVTLSESEFRPISIDVSGDDLLVTSLRSELLDLTEGLRPWYAILRKVNFFFVALGVYVALFLGLLLLVAIKWIPLSKTDDDPVKIVQAQLIIFGSAGALSLAAFVLNKFRDAIFPRAVFLIGQQKRHFNTLERIQWGVVIAFVVSFFAGVLLLLFQ